MSTARAPMRRRATSAPTKPLKPGGEPPAPRPKVLDRPPPPSTPGGKPRRGEMVPITSIDRHPINRQPTPAAIDARAESLAADGQLEDCTVRALPGGRYQMISGETRWLAAKNLGWSHLRCTVLDCTASEAARLVAVYNAERQDLRPIEKARLIESLCKPAAEGGPGLTREAAAKAVGLESGGAASNLVRLLKLPEVWQQRVDAGEVPESFARHLVPYAHAKRIMAEIDKHWRERAKPKSGPLQHRLEEQKWESRAGFAECIEYIVEANVRPLEGKRNYGYDLTRDYNYQGEFPRLFDLTPEIEKQLEIVEIETTEDVLRNNYIQNPKTVTARVATNVGLWDKLQAPALKKHVDAQRAKEEARHSSKQPKADGEPAPKLTAAERKAKEKKAAEQLEKRVARWKHAWLRSLVAREMRQLDNTTKPQLYERQMVASLKLLLWAVAADPRVLSGGDNFSIRLMNAAGESVPKNRWECDAEAAFEALPAYGPTAKAKLTAITTDFLLGLLETDDPNHSHNIPPSVVAAAATDLNIDIRNEWRKMLPRELLAGLFGLFTIDQLQQLGCKATSKKAAVDELIDLQASGVLALPAILADGKAVG